MIVRSEENARGGDRATGTSVMDTDQNKSKEILFEEPRNGLNKSRLFLEEEESGNDDVIDGWQIFTWRGFVELVKNDHIQAATVTGICIIALAYVFKRVLHIEISNLENSLPGFVFTLYEAVRIKATHPLLRRPLLWNLAALLVTALIILRRVYS